MVVVLLAIVVNSYRQTINAYPLGGGSYIVAKDNLGKYPSLVSGASMLVDYILTVAVSVSGGVAAIVSAFNGLAPYRVWLCVGFIVLITYANLRGIRESGALFAPPTYLYIVSLAALILVGLYRVYFQDLGPISHTGEVERELLEGQKALTLFYFLKAFSSGAVALTGIAGRGRSTCVREARAEECQPHAHDDGGHPWNVVLRIEPPCKASGATQRREGRN